MALTTCAECSKPISDKAAACPSCGAPVDKAPEVTTKKEKVYGWFWLIGCVFVVIWMLNNKVERDYFFIPPFHEASAPAPQLTPAQRAAEKKESDAAYLAILGAQKLKSSMRDPASFVLERAQTMDSGALCYVYRAKNGFGGFTRERALAPPNGTSIATHPSQQLWHRECEKGAAHDVTVMVARAL